MNKQEKEDIIALHLEVFGKDEGELVSSLARDFLEREDTISFSIKREEKLIANVLFTPFVFTNHPDAQCYLLAPLGVLKEYQGAGVARELIENAMNHLKSINVDAVFVLGVPTFYPKLGFKITEKETPYPELLTLKESWMAYEFTEGVLEKISGKTIAIEPFMKDDFWDTRKWTN